MAKGLIEKAGRDPLALADIVIYLPTRRAQRTFGDAFARALGGAALLPQFRALGDADEDEFQFDAETLDLPPAIAPMRRTLLLAAMVRRWHAATDRGRDGLRAGRRTGRQPCRRHGRDADASAELSQLDAFMPVALAAHWDRVRTFLLLLEDEWPKILAVEERINPAERRNRALAALAERVKTARGPIIAAGSTGSIPATADLLKAIAERPDGSVVLPGLDRELDAGSWDMLEPGHPQFGMKQLLGRLNVRREDVRDWDGTRNPLRERVLREALRPAPTTDAWRAIADNVEEDAIAEGTRGISLIEAADAAEEATAIALVLRERWRKKARPRRW